MSIIWMDGPDHYGTNVALLTQGPYANASNFVIYPFLVANGGPGGVGTVFNFKAEGYLRKVLPGERELVGIGARWFFGNLPPNNNSVCLYDWRSVTNTPVASLWLISTGAIELRRGDVNGALIYRSEPVIVASSWQHVEARLSFDVDNPGFELGIDSISVFSSDTIYITSLCAQVASFNGNINYDYSMRDYYIWDNTGAFNNSGMQGDRQVITVMPTGDTADDDWVPSTGALGWPLISEIPPNDADYISANAPDLLSMFDTEDIDTDITSISAMRLAARMDKSDAGLATVKMRVASSGDVALGPEQAVSTQKIYYSAMFETDPHTDLKWTPAGVNASTIGLVRED